MPKHRGKGEGIRVNKGKYGAQLHRDISEQHSEEWNTFSNCDEIFPAHTAETFQVDAETFDEIVLKAFEKFRSKSCQIRSTALTIACTQLQQTNNPDFLIRHYDRLTSIIQRALKNNIPCEMDAAATLLSLAAIQLPDSSRIIQMFYEPLIAAVNCEYLRLSTQFAVLHAIGVLTFLSETDQIHITLEEFKGIFAGKIFNSKATKKYSNRRMAAWTCAFLMTWTPQCSGKKPPIWSHVRQQIEKELETPIRELKIGRHVLNFSNWSLRVCYEMLCNVIGSINITKHLASNGKFLAKLLMAESTERSPFSARLKDIPARPSDGGQPSNACTSSTPARDDTVKLSGNLVLATDTSSVERAKAIEDICKELHFAPPEFLSDRINVIVEVILTAMQRSNEVEQLAAVRLTTLTAFQFACVERFYSEILNVFAECLQNLSTGIPTKALMCTALAFIELVNSERNERHNRTFIEPVMNLLQRIFFVTHPKHHQTLNDDSTTELFNILRTRALEAWGLLLTTCSVEDVFTLVKSRIIDELTEMMMNDSTAEFCIACGEVISLLVEQGRLRKCKDFDQNMSNTCTVIRNIIDDRRNASSDKRKLLNTNLRRVLKYMEYGCRPSFKVRFSIEIHESKTWSSIFKYQKLSRFIGRNVVAHYLENDRIRAIVPIGPEPVSSWWCQKPIEQYKLSCAATKKSRTKENRLNGRVPKFGYM